MYFKTYVGLEKLTSVYSVVYLKELEDGIQYKTNICIVFIAMDDSYVCTVCEETNAEN